MGRTQVKIDEIEIIEKCMENFVRDRRFEDMERVLGSSLAALAIMNESPDEFIDGVAARVKECYKSAIEQMDG